MRLRIRESTTRNRRSNRYSGGENMSDYLRENSFVDREYDVFGEIKSIMRREFSKPDRMDLSYRFIELYSWYTKIRVIRSDTNESLLFTVEYKDVYDGLIYATCNYRVDAGNKENVFESAQEFVDWMLSIVDDRLF